MVRDWRMPSIPLPTIIEQSSVISDTVTFVIVIPTTVRKDVERTEQEGTF